MSTAQIVGAVVGAFIIVVTVWQIIKNGIAKNNGRIPESDGSWSDWTGNS